MEELLVVQKAVLMVESLVAQKAVLLVESVVESMVVSLVVMAVGAPVDLKVCHLVMESCQEEGSPE
eukprot:2527368-Pleurochrysis_carterae.AAC.1